MTAQQRGDPRSRRPDQRLRRGEEDERKAPRRSAERREALDDGRDEAKADDPRGRAPRGAAPEGSPEPELSGPTGLPARLRREA